MAEQRERELRFERRMSDAEALMWNVEKDPWLNPNGASIAVLDGPIDEELFRRRVKYAISKIPRLRDRVALGQAQLRRGPHRGGPRLAGGTLTPGSPPGPAVR